MGLHERALAGHHRDFKAMSSSFEAIGAFTGSAVNLVGIGEPRRLAITPVTPDVLPLLGVTPALGRVFDAREDNGVAAIISYGLWQSQFGADPSVLGRTVHLDGVPHTIIGVIPRGFYFPTRNVQLWTALTFQDEDYADHYKNTYLHAVARLKPDVTFDQARADLEVIAARLSEQLPGDQRRNRDRLLPDAGRAFLPAPPDVHGARRRESVPVAPHLRQPGQSVAGEGRGTRARATVRAALGAGRERLMRQLGHREPDPDARSAARRACSWPPPAVPLFASLVPDTLPIATEPGLDRRVVAFAGVVHDPHGIGIRPLSGDSRRPLHHTRRASRGRPRGRRSEAASAGCW